MNDGVQLEVYYTEGHDWNVDKMLKAMATSLDYYTENFGPYQFDFARIIEFPRYASFAQAFAGERWRDESGRVWQEIDLSALVRHEQFLAISA